MITTIKEIKISKHYQNKIKIPPIKTSLP